MATSRPSRDWYWIVDEIEAAGCIPLMAHAAKAKVMMGNVNKTDKLDARGLATLLHIGSLPTVWLPPGEIRDERELHRTRMAFSKQRTALKNRVHSTLAKYAQSLDTSSDIFAPRWRPELTKACGALPPETQLCMRQHLVALDHVQGQIQALEMRIQQRVEITPNIQLLKTLPGVANILAIVIEHEMGSVDRFPSSAHFASYAGTVPTVKSSGGTTRYGRLRKQSNQYLKWAFRVAPRRALKPPMLSFVSAAIPIGEPSTSPFSTSASGSEKAIPSLLAPWRDTYPKQLSGCVESKNPIKIQPGKWSPEARVSAEITW
jgi:transposase